MVGDGVSRVHSSAGRIFGVVPKTLAARTRSGVYIIRYRK